MEFYLQQGKIVASNEFNPSDEWLNYRAKVNTSMWFAHGEIPFFKEHTEELNNYLAHLNLNYRIEEADQHELLRLAGRLINKNKAYMGGWVHIHFFLNNDSWKYIARIVKHPQRQVPFDEQGKLAVISEEKIWSKSNPIGKKYHQEIIWINESLKLAGTRYGDAVICNENGVVAGAIGANIFCVSENKIITPSLRTGCVNEHFRELTIEAAKKIGLEIIESESIVPDDLQHMDEIFTVSEQNGFKWIKGIGLKRFLKKKVEQVRLVVDELLWKDRNNKVEYR